MKDELTSQCDYGAPVRGFPVGKPGAQEGDFNQVNQAEESQLCP